MRKIFCAINLLLLALFVCPAMAQTDQRWPKQKIWDWYNKQPFYCGFNYIPAYAINYTAMWDKTSFDARAIDTELALAEKTGLNCLRAVLQYAVYEDDPEYFLNTLDQFLAICNKHNIKFMPALFDDCVFGIEHDPKVGKQPEPLKGWYAWAWSPSPGHSMVVDATTHPRIEKYVKAVIGRFKDDKRIFIWDLYNEPTNGGLGSASFPLLKKVAKWAREINPSQPITIDIWNGDSRLNDIALANSDIISFHNYGNKNELIKQITELKGQGRPLFNTEWMNRPNGSVIKDNLAVFYNEKVGCMLWGLVNGKTQTDLPWGHRPADPIPAVWQHDLFRGDFTPYDSEEVELLKDFALKSRNSSYLQEHQK
ncbi:glycoside hydrolase family 2 TIM barrel-domain containing protein [Pedobacter panaciterrae]|uniref:glycoside hydrolase family 2 TIM barrel-domain containing protein n=1 Tax=Pedobacter panaciterrae TaxID=363849 RepID=UPI002597AF9D|nr:glycoside hydrolase family 2 TIM barrel-domain containing protein [uncultured Pedobacter sp.]